MSSATSSTAMSKLRRFETLGFRPENAEQERLILEAQKATGITMADLLRRAVLIGLPRVVAEVRDGQLAAYEQFEQAMREGGQKRPKS